MNVFTHVTVRTLMKNKIRTIVTVIGILLATAMLTATAGFVTSLQDFMVRSVIAEMGDWYAAIYDVPEEKTEELSKSSEVSSLFTVQELGYAKFEEAARIGKPYLFAAGIDEGFNDAFTINLVLGRMPKNPSELVLPRSFLTEARIPVEIGDVLTLELGERYANGAKRSLIDTMFFDEDEETPLETLEIQETRTYTVVGIIEDLSIGGYKSAAYVALTVQDENPAQKSSYIAYLKTTDPDEIYSYMDEVRESYPVEYNSNLLRSLGSISQRNVMRTIYGLVGILILVIMIGGISLVYNSFSISVSDRTKQFGLLASMGASPRQRRSMVFKEAFIVSLIGIPLGLLSGLLGLGVTLHLPWIDFGYLYGSGLKMRLYVPIWALCASALIALLTVLISAWIPARRASRISPMEAIRQTKDIYVPKRVIRKGKLSFLLFGLPGMLAGKHFSRNRRQYRATVFSLFISVVLFLSASSFSAYIKAGISTVNEMVDYDIGVYMDLYQEWEKALEFAGNIHGLESVEAVLPVGVSQVEVIVEPEDLNDEYKTAWNARVSNGETDLMREDGRAILSSLAVVLKDDDYAAYLQEQDILLDAADGNTVPALIFMNRMQGYDNSSQRYRNFEVLKETGKEMDLVLTDYSRWRTARDENTGDDSEKEISLRDFQKEVPVSIGTFTERAPWNMYADDGGRFCFVISESTFQSMAGELDSYLQQQQICVKAVDDQKAVEDINRLLLLADSPEGVYVSDIAGMLKMSQNMMITANIFAYGFVGLISLIAAANVFNTISTSFLLRQKEFAVLSSVGMTPKALHKMLNFECVLYGSKALLYGIPVSVLVTYEIYRVIIGTIDMSFFIPAESLGIAVCSVFLVVFSTMWYARKKLEGANLIDSIRQESV